MMLTDNYNAFQYALPNWVNRQVSHFRGSAYRLGIPLLALLKPPRDSKALCANAVVFKASSGTTTLTSRWSCVSPCPLFFSGHPKRGFPVVVGTQEGGRERWGGEDYITTPLLELGNEQRSEMECGVG